MQKALNIFFIIILLSANSYAKGGRKEETGFQNLNYLKDVEVFSNAGEIKIAFDFKKPLKNTNQNYSPSFYEKSFQIYLPNTYINPSKRQFKIGDKLISDIYAFQYSPDTVKLRFMFGKDKTVNQDYLSINNDVKRITILIKRPAAVNKTVNEKDHASGAEPAVLPDLKTLMDETVMNVQSESVNKNEQSTEILQKEPLFKNSYTSAMPDMYSSYVKMFSSLLILLSGILIIFYFLKKYFLKGGRLPGKNKLIKVLSTSYIGTKQTIAVLDVADEVLVVGISNNHISMLTKLEDNKIIKKLKGDSAKKDKIGGMPSFSEYLDKLIPLKKDTKNLTSDLKKDKEDSIVMVKEMIQKRLNVQT